MRVVVEQTLGRLIVSEKAKIGWNERVRSEGCDLGNGLGPPPHPPAVARAVGIGADDNKEPPFRPKCAAQRAADSHRPTP
jgi:hypothetical protein